MIPTPVIRYFNSIKVQLKLVKSSNEFGALRFQFHKGTIKTPLSPFEQVLKAISIP